jgi:hypothetical protein
LRSGCGRLCSAAGPRGNVLQFDDEGRWCEFAKGIQNQNSQQISWHKELAKSGAPDLLCNWQGFMLGRGIVWLNPDASVLKINKF